LIEIRGNYGSPLLLLLEMMRFAMDVIGVKHK
jgi:hypothetical protein